MKNIYGEPISHITVVLDDWEKGTSGKVYRGIGKGGRWYEVCFKGFDDVLGAINSLLEPEVLTNAARYIASSSNLSPERKDEVQGVVVSPNLDIIKSDMKKQTISMLEKALERLKSNC